MEPVANVSQALRHVDGRPAIRKVPEAVRNFLRKPCHELMNANFLSASCTLTPFPPPSTARSGTR